MDTAQGLYEQGIAAYQSSDFPKATQLLTEAVTLDSKHWQAWRMLGFVLLANKEFSKAEKAFESAIFNNEQDADNYFGLGCAKQELGEHALAIGAFENALRKNPQHPAVKMKIAVSYDIRGDELLAAANLMGAEQYYEKVYKYTQTEQSYHKLLNYYDKAGQSGKASLVQQEWAARH